MKDKSYVDIGSKLIEDAVRNGEDPFPDPNPGPERLTMRPLSREERVRAQESSLNCTYVPPSVKRQK